MKVLFLDIDGVLNCKRDLEVIVEKPTNRIINQKFVERLNDIIEETGCKIVLSSTWRKFPDDVEWLKEFFPIYDTTPNLNSPRGEEIRYWLKEYGKDVVKYCIVDDDGDMLDDQLRHFVQTTFDDGLTETLAYRIKRRLE